MEIIVPPRYRSKASPGAGLIWPRNPPWLDPDATSGQNATRKALYDQIRAYGGIPPQMAGVSVTLGSAGGAATIGGSFVGEDAPGAFLYYGKTYREGTYPRNQGYRWDNYAQNLALDDPGAVNGAISFSYDGAIFEHYVLGAGSAWAYFADGEYIGSIKTASDSQFYYVKVDLGSAAPRTITAEWTLGDDCLFFGVQKEAGTTIAAPADRLRFVLVSDSFGGTSGVAGTAAPLTLDPLFRRIPWNLGFRAGISSSVGGAGWIRENSGQSLPNLLNRYTRDLITGHSYDVFVFANGLNDTNLGTDAEVEAAAIDCIADVRAARPDALIYVLGPWDTNAPSATIPGYAGIKAAMQGAVAGVPGAYFIDMQGVAFEKYGEFGDNTHPSGAVGHHTLGDYVRDRVKASLGLAA